MSHVPSIFPAISDAMGPIGTAWRSPHISGPPLSSRVWKTSGHSNGKPGFGPGTHKALEICEKSMRNLWKNDGKTSKTIDSSSCSLLKWAIWQYTVYPIFGHSPMACCLVFPCFPRKSLGTFCPCWSLQMQMIGFRVLTQLQISKLQCPARPSTAKYWDLDILIILMRAALPPLSPAPDGSDI